MPDIDMKEMQRYTESHWKNVVLCKECRYLLKAYSCYICRISTAVVTLSDYCSKGKRIGDKENETD